MDLILDEILAHKRQELAELRARHAGWRPPAARPARRDFLGALRGSGMSLVAEFKRKSPSRGDIQSEADPRRVARAYQDGGAAAMSVLTDLRFFGGGLEDLERARGAVSLPVLRKDFILDPAQIAASAGPEGPDCVLLLASVLEAAQLRALRGLADQCGQAALVEVHDEDDLARALESGAEIIGINNRDLQTFEVSLETTLRLRPRVPDGFPVVSESGIHCRDDVRRLEEAGVDAILVGEAVMAAESPGDKIRELLGTP